VWKKAMAWRSRITNAENQTRSPVCPRPAGGLKIANRNRAIGAGAANM
jgi:hypothetical protein